jgi:hypothetical protein
MFWCKKIRLADAEIDYVKALFLQFTASSGHGQCLRFGKSVDSVRKYVHMNKYECQIDCGKGDKFKEIKIQETSILQKKGVNFYDLCRITD